MSNRIAAFVIIWFGIVAFSSEAFAYRPFDGTDAAVVSPGELEVELGLVCAKHVESLYLAP